MTEELSQPVPARPLKVLFHYLDYGAVGGIERYILETATRLKEKGRIDPVVTCSADGWLYQGLLERKIKVHGIQSARCFAGSAWRMLDLSAMLQWTQILRREKPDVVHVHIGLLENLLPRFLGYPVVYSAHGYSTLYSMQGVTSPVKRMLKRCIRFLFRKTAAQMDALLFVSQAERQRMEEEAYIAPKQPASVIHNGVDLKAWRETLSQVDTAAVKKRLGIPAEARVASFINRLDPNKNPLHFVELAKQLLSQPDFRDVHFVLAGDGPLMGLVRLHSLNSPQIKVLGYYEDTADLLAISDLLVYPSLKEGFGLGLLEAMVCGTPCVAYASGGALELLDTPETRDCLTPVGDLQALTDKAKAFLLAPKSQKAALGAALQKRAECFDLSVMLERLETVYRQLRPLVSVILPVYQGEETILRAVSSVLNQSYPHLELIVMDDGSSDATLKRLETISDPRLKVLTQSNQGVAKARNHAFEHACGEYIAFIDADDIWLPGKLAEELKVARRQQQAGQPVGLVYSSYYAVDERNRLVNLPKVRRERGDIAQVALEDEGLFLPSTTLVHRSVFESVGGFQPGCYHEDRVFFIQATQRFPAAPTGKRLVVYRQSLTGRCRRILSDYDQAVRAELSIVETLREQLPAGPLLCLEQRQLLNLSTRFLMYGFLDSARQVNALLPKTLRRSGLKVKLAHLSLRTGINFLYALRLCIQQGVYPLLGPWWNFKMRNSRFHASKSGSANSMLPAATAPVGGRVC